MVAILQASESLLPDVAAFYESVGYRAPLRAEDEILVAREEGTILGSVRLCREQGCLVLRGLFVAEERQKEGIGRRLLDAAIEAMKDSECWCIPYAHLELFYERVGFERVPIAQIPRFLAERAEGYRSIGAPVLVMKRTPGARVPFRLEVSQP